MDNEELVCKKLKTVLNSFLVHDFCKENHSYLEMLVTHLSSKEHNILQSPVVLDWIGECVNILMEDFNKIHDGVVSFMLKLCAVVAENEWLMIALHEKNTLEKIDKIASKNVDKFTPSIKLGHIRLLATVSTYSLGLRWIKASKSWRYLIRYCSSSHTIYVVREASSLIYEILYKFSAKTYDEDLCLEILREILKPIDENVYEDTSMMVNVDDTDIQKDLCATLDLISIIFQKTLESSEKTPISHLCETHHKLEVNIWKLTEMTHNEFFLGKILKAQTSYNFAMLVYEKWKNKEIDPLDFNRFGVNFFNTMKFCISRRGCVNFLKLAKLNHYLWKKLGSRAPSEIFIENESIQFENQLIMFHIMPLLCIVKTQHEEEGIFDDYVMKLFSISSEFTVRICYSFRDILLDCPSLAAHLTYKSIHGVLSMKTILNKDQAVVVFQALVYALKEFANETFSTNNSVEITYAQENLVLSIPQVLYATLVCLYTLVEGYNITWKESIETMCLLDIVLEILKNPNLSTLMVVQAIKLTQLSIEHFLSPNMALLVDNLRGSALQNLGPIIIYNFHHAEWEIRDSTLELVTSVVSISRLKFPAFQQYVLENDICSLVFSIVKNDQESYVRASGLKSLTQMVAVNVLWDKSLIQLNLVDYLLEIIGNESEGIVRKEAIACITQMYVHRRISPQNCITLYSTLGHCAVYDLYWEVKVSALNFWEIEIFLQFTNQGMIDGTFPTVTFSKENKKIVTLTEAEIILRIKKVLNELSQIGCLDVILKCLNDDCDLEAVKVAVRVIKNLFKKLEKYDYEKALDEVCSHVDAKNENAAHSVSNDDSIQIENKSNEQNYESLKRCVIDDIVSTSDLQLVIDSYRKQMNFGTETHHSSSPLDNAGGLPKNCAVITPVEFIDRLKGLDFDELIQKRSDWFHCSENLPSLLDDIILSSNIENPFYADCY